MLNKSLANENFGLLKSAMDMAVERTWIDRLTASLRSREAASDSSPSTGTDCSSVFAMAVFQGMSFHSRISSPLQERSMALKQDGRIHSTSIAAIRAELRIQI